MIIIFYYVDGFTSFLCGEGVLVTLFQLAPQMIVLPSTITVFLTFFMSGTRTG